MQQLEIQYFFPLTEQVPLDLDYTNCDTRVFTSLPIVGGTGLVLMSNGVSPTWSQRFGDWEIPNETKQPNKLQKFLMKYFLGWKWMGK